MENIDRVKLLYSAFSVKDISSILDMLSDDVEWGEPENPYNPSSGTRIGHDGFLEWIHIGKEVEDILELSPKRFLCNDDSVVVVGHMKCLAKSKCVEYESDFVHLFVFRDSKICKFQEFFDTYIAGEAFR